MPTYEYECDTCKKIFEEYQSITAEPVTACRTPECKGKVHRLMSGGAGFLFKGSGFYITDYRSDSYKKGEKADSSSSPGSTSGDSSKSADASKSADTSKSSDSTKSSDSSKSTASTTSSASTSTSSGTASTSTK